MRTPASKLKCKPQTLGRTFAGVTMRFQPFGREAGAEFIGLALQLRHLDQRLLRRLLGISQRPGTERKAEQNGYLKMPFTNGPVPLNPQLRYI